MKTVHILVGPKGAGKTHIGNVVQQELGVKFIHVEPIWLSLEPGEDGWKKVEQTIEDALTEADEVIIETLGAGDGFTGLRDGLAKKYQLRFIKIMTDLNECMRRVRTRSSAKHIPVSDDQVAAYNAIAAKVEHPWSAVIDNNGPASTGEILQAFRGRGK